MKKTSEYFAILGIITSFVILILSSLEFYIFYTTEDNTYFDLTATFVIVFPILLFIYNVLAYKIFKNDVQTAIRKFFFDSTFLVLLLANYFLIYFYIVILYEGWANTDTSTLTVVFITFVIPLLVGISTFVNLVGFSIRKKARKS